MSREFGAVRGARQIALAAVGQSVTIGEQTMVIPRAEVAIAIAVLPCDSFADGRPPNIELLLRVDTRIVKDIETK